MGNKTVHPNNASYEETEKSIAQLRESVYRAWSIHYQTQGNDIFVWPQGLPQSFLEVVKELRPIESKAKYSTKPLDELLSIGDRETYRDYIKDELPNLATIIHATWSKKATAGDAKKNNQLVVVWDPSNQEYVTKLFDWTNSQRKAPTTLEVLYAQEDLWLLTSIMHVIKNTNGEADAPHNAIIKKVHSILLGRAAASKKSGSISKGSSSSSREGGSPGGGESNLEETDEAEGNEGEGGSVRLEYLADPAEGRYVDREYKPIPAAQLRSAAVITDPDRISPLSIAKRMPIRLKVTMDQRRINDLLAECANSALTIEVNQVRILGSASGSSPVGQNDDEKAFPYDAIVELFGIIYIYNPVPFDLDNSDSKDAPDETAATNPENAVSTR